MSDKLYVGIDNGSTGWIAVLDSNGAVIHFGHIPTMKEQSYTKTAQEITRLDHERFKRLLTEYLIRMPNFLVILERPMVMPARFKQSMAALRFLEATLICLEQTIIPYQYIDSRTWQKEFLPEHSANTKVSAREIAGRKFPRLKNLLTLENADALLIAEYARSHRL
jgi:hypothetical protein